MPRKPCIIYNLDRPRTMRMSMNNMCLIEDKLGIPMTSIDYAHVGFKEIRTIVFCTLEDKHELTEEKLGDLIDEYSNVKEAADKLKEATELAFGEKKDQPAEQATETEA